MQKKIRLPILVILSVLIISIVAGSHPHFRKIVTAKLPDLELKLEYTTYPWNPSHLAEVKDGFIFHCGNASVELSNAAKHGSVTVPAGKYQLRARAKDVDNWTFLLIPVPEDRNAKPDITKAVELPTKTFTGRPVRNHLLLDVSAGHGETDNMALFVLLWGDRELEGVLADFSMPRK